MAEDQEKCAIILKALRFSQRGLTVTDISRKIRVNRNITAQQLEILRAQGKVDVRKIGSARVFSLAQRVPLSAFLCFTRNMILILDKNLTVVQVNDQYSALTGLKKQELIGQHILGNALPIVSDPEALAIIQSTENEQVITDIRFLKGGDERFCKMEVIPTTFETGDTGLTIVLEDITEKKRHLKNMEFLARTAMELVDMPPGTDIYQYIAERITELLPEDPKCYVESYEEMTGQFLIRAVGSPEFRKKSSYLAGGKDLIGITFPVRDFFSSAPFFETPSTMKEMREMRFRPFHEEEQISFYDLCAHQFPRELCETFIQKHTIGKMYLTGLVWQEQLFGVVGICLGTGEVLENKQAIESFLRQVSIAIARRMTEDRLSRSEQRFFELVTLSGLPAVILDQNGHVTLVNPRFTEMSGYAREDIPTREALAEKAFPGSAFRNEAVPGLDPVLRDERVLRKGTCALSCRDGKQKSVIPRPVILSDSTQVVMYEVLN